MKRFSDWRKDPYVKVTKDANKIQYIGEYLNYVMARSAGGNKNKWTKLNIIVPDWWPKKHGKNAILDAMSFLIKKKVIEIKGEKVRLVPKYYEWDLARKDVGSASKDPNFTKGT